MSSSESAFTINDISQLMETLQKLTKQDDDEPASQKSVDTLLVEIKRLKRDVKIAAWAICSTITIGTGILALVSFR